jgi:L-arabinose isomerase
MALHFMYYNFVHIHQTLKMTPAMAAGVTKRLWEVSDIVDVLEAWEASGGGHHWHRLPLDVG